MRKQDRIANQQQDRPPDPPRKEQQPRPKEREQVKGGTTQTPGRPRELGKMPLPD